MIKVFSVTVCLLLSITASAADRETALDELLTSYYELGQFNGVALVAEDDGVLLRRGYGLADRERDRPNEPDTRFLIGSISKSLTSRLVFKFVDDGKLDLEKTIADYLPYYRRDTGTRISLRHLLAHTDGLSNYTRSPDFWQPYEDGVRLSTREFVQAYCSSDLQFDPGTEYRYGNSSYTILAAILEEISGKSFAELLESQLLGPLNMSNSGDTTTGLPKTGLAKGYQIGPDGYRLAEPIYKPLMAAGSMYATADDLFTHVDSLDPDTLMPRITHGVEGEAFSYGWKLAEHTSQDAAAVSHVLSTNGEVNGYNALLIRVIESRQTVILLNNTGEAELLAIAANILQVLNGEPATQPQERTRDIFYRTLEQQGVATAIAYYHSQHSVDPGDYIYFRWPLRILAGQLMSDGRVDDAVEFLRLNLETHPDDSQSAAMLENALARNEQLR